MDILLVKSTKTVQLVHDLFGNAFLLNGNDMYYVSIDSDNSPEVFKVNKNRLTDLSAHDIDYTTGKIHSGVSSLKGAVEDEVSRKIEEQDTEDELTLNNQYFPEHKYFYKEGGDVKTDYVSTLDVDPMFKFFGYDEKYVTKIGYDSNALYSFLVVNGNTKSKDVTFLSEEFNNTCSYRLTFYTDGYIKCNVVGTSEKIFKLVEEEGTLKVTL